MIQATRIIARSDAMYCGVAMAVTILELALIATNSQLGAHALEMALLLQLIISASLEFYAGAALNFYIGMAKAMLMGFALKLGSAISFLIGFYLSYQDMMTLTWCFLVMAFILDAIGTGCLKSTFRPTYNRVHLTLTGESANYATIAFSFLTLRLLLPFTLLLLASYTLSFWRSSHAAAMIFSTIILCRSIQLFYAHLDLKHIHGAYTKKQNIHIVSLRRLLMVYQRNTTAFYGFLTGNLFESVILMYAIGLLYQYKHYLKLPEFLSWLGSSMIALTLYFISVIVGGRILIRLADKSLAKSLSLLFFSMTLSSSLWLVFSTSDLSLFYALTAFSFSGVIIGLVLMRLSTNSILKVTSDAEAIDFFLLVEAITTILIIVIATAALFIFGPDGLLKGLGLGITLIMFIYFFHLYGKPVITPP